MSKMNTNQKKAALRSIGIHFHMQGATVIRCEESKQLAALIEHPMHWSVDSIAKAVCEIWENPDVQDRLAVQRNPEASQQPFPAGRWS